MTEQNASSQNAAEQFGRQAEHYAVSTGVHAHSEGLDVLQEYASLGDPGVAVDIATGAGFTAFAVAPYVERALATDIAAGMLRQAGQLAAEQGLDNVELAFVEAEHMPFADGSLDMVTCRQAAHHFYDLPLALREINRVLKPGGVFLLSDTCAPEDDAVAEWMNDVELRRDVSHVWDRKQSEWRVMLQEVGLSVTHLQMVRVHLEFNDWVKRSATPQEKVEPLRRDFLSASEAVVDAFEIEPEGDGINFSWPVVVSRAVK